jgi:hypothetical protein
MIELESLKAQLRLLGHELDDETVKGILGEMNIDFSTHASASTTAEAAPPQPGEAADGGVGAQGTKRVRKC